MPYTALRYTTFGGIAGARTTRRNDCQREKEAPGLGARRPRRLGILGGRAAAGAHAGPAGPGGTGA